MAGYWADNHFRSWEKPPQETREHPHPRSLLLHRCNLRRGPLSHRYVRVCVYACKRVMISKMHYAAVGHKNNLLSKIVRSRERFVAMRADIRPFLCVCPYMPG